jgi:hypothetical protein
MNLISVGLLLDALIIGIIFLCTNPNSTPLHGKPPYRICGIFVIKHIIITFVSGSLIGYLSDLRPIGRAIFFGIAFQFFFGQLVHCIFNVKTMLLNNVGLSPKPDGTGHLAEPVA